MKPQIHQNSKLIFALIALFFCGYFAGKYTSKPIIQTNTITKIDSFYSSSSPLEIVKYSKPKNIYYYDTVIKHDTMFKFKDTGSVRYVSTVSPYNSSVPTSWRNTDSLHLIDSVYIAINDSGNCYGLQKRKSVVYGSKFEKTIIKENTITKTITIPKPLFSIYGGFGISGTMPLQLKDIGPIATLSIKEAQLISLGYQLQQKQFTFNFQTKIK